MTSETITPGTIVVGYAGSQDADHAVKWAAERAVLENLTLTLVHALEPVTGYEFGAMAGAYMVPDDITDALELGGGKLLAEGRDAVLARFPSLAVVTFLSRGRADQVLLDRAGTASAIVVGSRGRGRIASVFLGSVGVAVARAATCPVIVVRPHHPGKVRKGVLVATDCTEITRPTLEFAYREASLRGLPLTVLYSVPGLRFDGAIEALDRTVAGLDEQRLQLAEAVAGMGEKFPDVHVRSCLGSGFPDTWLTSQSDSTDLIVVGHHRTSGFGDVVGAASYAPIVIEHAKCPVAVIFEAPA
ncbi:MAG: UspA domain protein [Marmoricola sp.]|nr:UspA domain protein [Marmoricola sp.]